MAIVGPSQAIGAIAAALQLHKTSQGCGQNVENREIREINWIAVAQRLGITFDANAKDLITLFIGHGKTFVEIERAGNVDPRCVERHGVRRSGALFEAGALRVEVPVVGHLAKPEIAV